MIGKLKGYGMVSERNNRCAGMLWFRLTGEEPRDLFGSEGWGETRKDPSGTPMRL